MLPVFSSLNDEAQEALYDSIKDLYSIGKIKNVPGVGDIAKVDGERINSDDYLVFSLNGKLYQLDGYYNSYEGTTWNGLDSVYEVVESTKTITVYNKV